MANGARFGTGPVAVTPQAFWANMMARDAAMARYQGPEQFDQRNVTFPSVQTLLPINLRRPLEEILLRVAFRVTVTVAGYTDVGVEAPQSIIKRITLRGNHSKFGSQTPIDLSGATAFVYPLLFQRSGGQVYTSVGGGALTLAANPTVPFTSPFTGAVATHDIIVLYRIPLTPILGADQSAKRQNANYLFYQRDWQDTLLLEIEFGDSTALGDPTGATVAFTAFGSAGGSPVLQTLLNYGLLGEFENKAIPGIVLRNEQLFANLTAAGNQLRIAQLQRQITNAIMVKSGVIETGGAPTGTYYDTLSDVILDRTQVQVDFKPVRRVDNNFAERAYVNGMMNNAPMQGYFPITFIESQNPLTAYRGDSPSIASADFSLFSDVLTTSADQRVQVVQERVIGGFYPAIQ